MPKDGARQREDEILDLVCSALSTDGRTLTLVDRPDRPGRSAPDLTVDAVIKVSEDSYDARWAADVCLASNKFNPKVPAAMRELRQLLSPALTDLAAKVGRCVSVSCRPYVRLDGVGRREWRRRMAGVVRNIIGRAMLALAWPGGEYSDPEVSIRWQQVELWPHGDRVLLTFHDPFPGEGFRFADAVTQKLTNQLSRAHVLGYPTLLILDQKSPRYVDWIINHAPEPHEIGEGLAFLIGHHRTRLDACVLVENDDSVHEIYKRVGAPNECGCVDV